MAGRYLITGVQLGLLKQFAAGTTNTILLERVEDDQFVGNSQNDIKIDVDALMDEWIFRKPKRKKCWKEVKKNVD